MKLLAPVNDPSIDIHRPSPASEFLDGMVTSCKLNIHFGRAQ